MKPLALLTPKAFARTLLSVALVAAYSSASALDLPEFTWNPAGAGLTGTSFTADNIIVSDFATVTFTSGTTFHEEGYLGGLELPAERQGHRRGRPEHHLQPVLPLHRRRRRTTARSAR